jgi:hypothetical protein
VNDEQAPAGPNLPSNQSARKETQQNLDGAPSDKFPGPIFCALDGGVKSDLTDGGSMSMRLDREGPGGRRGR